MPGNIKGIFYGVSTGPGDPELMTVKAVRILKEADVIAAARVMGKQETALEIAKQAVGLDGKEILQLNFSMSGKSEAERREHENSIRQIEALLEAGKNVAMTVLGDVSVYASWQYLAEQIRKDGYQTVMIPGVTSFCAAAAAANTGLTRRDLPLHIVPASYGNLEKQMQPEGNYVLMKAGKCMEKIHKVLETKSGVREVFSIKNCGLPGEVVKDGLLENEAYGYFTTVIVKE